LFLGKSTKSAATSEVHFLTPICTKLFVGWGFVPDPTGELTAPPALQSLYLYLGGLLLKGGERSGGNGRGGEEGVRPLP